MSDLGMDKLILAVDNGILIGEDLIVRRDLSDAIERFVGEQWGDFCSAYEGHIDAAIALKNTLLPRWDAHIKIAGDGNPNRVELVELSCGREPRRIREWGDNPARAMLLAIIKASRPIP